MAEKCVPEDKETPQMEAKSHPAKFLAKATELATEKKGGKKAIGGEGKEKAGHKSMPKAKRAAGKKIPK